MIAPKLKKDDEIRIISPARSMSIISSDSRKIALERLQKLGFKVTFSKHAEEKDEFNSSSIKSRIEDLHEAFKDKNVKAILTTIGGFNSNQLLKYIDFDLIQKNPKILCGFSDITALQNSILAKTRLIGYYGPHFSSFGMKNGFDYTLDYFKKCLTENNKMNIFPSKEWSDDPWYMEQDKREFIKNRGYLVINEGEAEGKIIGGNLCTFNLLHGTEFMPSLKDSILFLEDDDVSNDVTFDRDLQSIIHQPGFEKVKGIVIGRFQKKSDVSNDKLMKIIKTKKELDNIPVIANADFGHTTPIFTFPIGGKAKLIANKKDIFLEIIEH
jgi:muramoyltetrapeptide carboxypeptidase LdcA involved in peptidoglycan recycling